MRPRFKGTPPRRLLREADAMRDWLAEMRFDYFVTLASNDPMASNQKMRKNLSLWDARLNREFLGKRWLQKPDERLNWIAFLESPGYNPHWHLLIQLLPGQADEFREKLYGKGWVCGPEWQFELKWRQLVSSGTCDVQRIETEFVKAYVTKKVHDPENWGEFVTFRDLFDLHSTRWSPGATLRGDTVDRTPS